jgi:hypothetical protein
MERIEEIRQLEEDHGYFYYRDKDRVAIIEERLEELYAQYGVPRTNHERVYMELQQTQRSIRRKAGYCHAYDPPCSAANSLANAYQCAADLLNNKFGYCLCEGYK